MVTKAVVDSQGGLGGKHSPNDSTNWTLGHNHSSWVGVSKGKASGLRRVVARSRGWGCGKDQLIGVTRGSNNSQVAKVNHSTFGSNAWGHCDIRAIDKPGIAIGDREGNSHNSGVVIGRQVQLVIKQLKLNQVGK